MSAMQCNRDRNETHKLFEAVGRMDDRWGSIVRVCPSHGGVELVGMGLSQVR